MHTYTFTHTCIYIHTYLYMYMHSLTMVNLNKFISIFLYYKKQAYVRNYNALCLHYHKSTSTKLISLLLADTAIKQNNDGVIKTINELLVLKHSLACTEI